MRIPIDKLLQISNSPTESLKFWLHYGLSLTEELKSQSGEAKLEIISQNWSQPTWWDKFTLGLSDAPSLIHRDILMFSRQIPCWFARTVIPEDTYNANRVIFDRLAEESLGCIVFKEPTIRRELMHNYAINDRCLEYHWLPDPLKKSFANQKIVLDVRLSVFTIAEKTSFFLAEILLPGLLKVVK